MQGTSKDLIMFLMDAPKDKTWVLEEYKEKKHRSLTQNAYYWQLLEKMAVKKRIPKSEIHNINLRHLGLTETIDGKKITILIPDTDEAEKKALQAETYHIAPTRQIKVGTDGLTYRFYIMLRGSHDMNATEMSALIELAVQDAKELGIETLTPQELQHMKELEINHERRNTMDGSI